MFKRKKVGVKQDILEVTETLSAIGLPKDYRQSGQEYKDFRAVLVNCNAHPEQAKRVLLRIMNWGSLLAPVHEEGDPFATHVRIGAQQLCQRILMALNTIPNTEEEDDG